MKFDDAVAALTAEGMTGAVAVITELRDRKRRQSHLRSPTVSRKVTPEVREKIFHLHFRERLANHQIAAKLEINQGRVSEVLWKQTREYCS